MSILPLIQKVQSDCGSRQIIRKAAPGAEELISYQIPAFRFHGMLVFMRRIQTFRFIVYF